MAIVTYSDREAWELSRSEPGTYRIGASEIGAILGASPEAMGESSGDWDTPMDVWARHHAPHLLRPRKGKQLDAGNAWEPRALAIYAAEHRPGWRVIRPQWAVAVHPEHPWLRATPDAWLHDTSGWDQQPTTADDEWLVESAPDGLAEVKTIMVRGAADVWPADGAVITPDMVPEDFESWPIPVYILSQTWAQIDCTRAPWVDIVACIFAFGPPEIRVIRVMPGGQRWADILRYVVGWRERHLIAGAPPDPTDPDSAKLLIRWRYPVRGPRRPATDEERALLADMAMQKQRIKRAEADMDAAKTRAITLMADAEAIYFDGASFSRSKNNTYTLR